MNECTNPECPMIDLPESTEETNSGEKQNSVKFSHDEDPTVSGVRFKARRRMAWVSLISMIAVIGIVLFKLPADQVDNYGTIIAWAMATFSGVILAFMGATSISYISWLNKNKK